MVIDNAITKMYCISLIMAYSREKRVQFSLISDSDAIYEVIQQLFDEFGGITQDLLIDTP